MSEELQDKYICFDWAIKCLLRQKAKPEEISKL